jgi:hypothetical protein
MVKYLFHLCILEKGINYGIRLSLNFIDGANTKIGKLILKFLNYFGQDFYQYGHLLGDVNVLNKSHLLKELISTDTLALGSNLILKNELLQV